MSCETVLQRALVEAQANSHYTEAVLTLDDGSRLCFCHRVGERWSKAVGPQGREEQAGSAGRFLSEIKMFRLNAKHLEIQFQDGSRWDERIDAVS